MLRKLYSHRGVRAAIAVFVFTTAGVFVAVPAATADTTSSPTVLGDGTYWQLPGQSTSGTIADGIDIPELTDGSGNTVQHKPTPEEICGQSECTWTGIIPEGMRNFFGKIGSAVAQGFRITVDKTKSAWQHLTWPEEWAWQEEPHLDNASYVYPTVTANVRMPFAGDIRTRTCWSVQVGNISCRNTTGGQNLGGAIYQLAWPDESYAACSQQNFEQCRFWVEYAPLGTLNTAPASAWTVVLTKNGSVQKEERSIQLGTANPPVQVTPKPTPEQKEKIVIKQKCLDANGTLTTVSSTQTFTFAQLKSGNPLTIIVPPCSPGKKSGGVDVTPTPPGTSVIPPSIFTTNNTYVTNYDYSHGPTTVQQYIDNSWVWCAAGANCSTVTQTAVNEKVTYRCVAQDGTVVEGENCTEIVARLNAVVTPNPTPTPTPVVVTNVEQTCMLDFDCWKTKFSTSIVALPFRVYDDFLRPDEWQNLPNYSTTPACQGIAIEFGVSDLVSSDLGTVTGLDGGMDAVRNAYHNHPILNGSSNIPQAGGFWSQQGGVHLRPFSVCNPTVKKIADILRGFQAGLLYVFGAWFISRKIFQVLGFYEFADDDTQGTAEKFIRGRYRKRN